MLAQSTGTFRQELSWLILLLWIKHVLNHREDFKTLSFATGFNGKGAVDQESSLASTEGRRALVASMRSIFSQQILRELTYGHVQENIL